MNLPVEALRSKLPVLAAAAFALAMFVPPAQAAPLQSLTSGPLSLSQDGGRGGAILLARSRKTRRQPDENSAPSGGVAGRYALLRENDKDSGCLLTLRPGGRAQLGPGCKDQGLVVFDPQSWSSGRGSIILRARKGHRLTFVRKPDGIYVRDPADKRPLALRKY